MLWLLAAASAAPCSSTSIPEISSLPSPGIIVLGERKGTQPDLRRADRIVHALQRTGQPITIGLQAVSVDKQPVLDAYAAGEVEPGDLTTKLDWDHQWGFPYPPYAPLVTAAVHDHKVLGLGLPTEPKPQEALIPIAPNYIRILSDAMSGHLMPPQLEGAFVQTVSWLDYRTTKAALDQWSGDGYLVLVVDRTQVEGGKGIPYQAARLSDIPVTSVLLAGEGACYDNDRFLPIR